MKKLDLVGILNVTPDSFSGDGQPVAQAAISQAEQMFKAGVAFVDIGAESTRPGARALSDAEEWRRLEPVFKDLVKRYPSQISLDSYHPETLKNALGISRHFIVNDVTGLNNPKLAKLVIDHNLRVIISHFPLSLGQDIQAGHQPDNKIDSLGQVRNELLARRKQLIDGGLSPGSIVLDPGIGFGKTIELNEKLLRFAQLVPDIEVMIGYSKKSFMGEERMSVARNLDSGKISASSGARYLRLHADLLGSHKKLFKA